MSHGMNTDQHGNNPCYSVFFRGLFTRVIPCFSVAYLPVLFRVFPWLIHPCYSVFFRGLFTRVIPCFSVAYSPVLFRVFPWLSLWLYLLAEIVVAPCRSGSAAITARRGPCSAPPAR